MIKFYKTPLMIDFLDKTGIANEYRAYLIMVFGRKLFSWKSFTGNQYRKVKQLPFGCCIEDIKPGNKIVYSQDNFIPYEYEPIL